MLGVINIVYGAFVAFGQTHLMRRLAYASVSHMGFVLIGIGAYTAIGMNGAMLQLISHGLIAAATFYLAGVVFDRTGTLWMDKITGLAKEMPRAFALFTILVLAGVGLPGTSAFVGEITVLLGIGTSEVYSTAFKALVIFLSVVGVIVTPIYFFSTLRVVFYGSGKTEYNTNRFQLDVSPREVFITGAVIVPVIVLGFYPKLLTNTFDDKTAEVAELAKAALPTEVQLAERSTTEFSYPRSLPAGTFIAPAIADK
ncbi:MAG: proton-conducting transporter membrane subunit, partial [Prochloraceae cyanobacterium]|nr:proton-conducting transporter membrane subunit [Prochloraceae cyanobacterium]